MEPILLVCVLAAVIWAVVKTVRAIMTLREQRRVSDSRGPGGHSAGYIGGIAVSDGDSGHGHGGHGHGGDCGGHGGGDCGGHGGW